jgi:hypothetical protein
MKLIGPILLALLVLSGCASHYVVTLNNGGQITATTKPKLSNGAWHFKDSSGQEQYVPSGRVHEIAPASMMEQPAKAKSKPQEKKHWYFLWLA